MIILVKSLTSRFMPATGLKIALVVLFLLSGAVSGEQAKAEKLSLEETCVAISSKLASVSLNDCLEGGLIYSGSHSINNVPILVREYPPLKHRVPQARVLLVGGTHGDEYSSVSVVFRWMQTLNVHHSGLFHWVFVPLLNPDGLLLSSSTRINSRGVDINRNFPGPLWQEAGFNRWVDYTDRNPRYYPGPSAMSEPETLFLVRLITNFKPDVIISLHSPLGLVDYDGPGSPPSRLGGLGLRRLGNFPGTLGNFAGKQLGIPVITIEFSSSGRMPSMEETSSMWRDLVRWLVNNAPVKHDPERLKAQTEQLELKKEFFGK
jgi:murein peptide amidase A